MAKKVTNIEVKDTSVRTMKHEGEDYVCITDIARQKNAGDPNGVIANWMRNRNTIEFLGIWEQLFNPTFNPLEFEGFRKEAGLNAFTMSPQKWIEATHAHGLISMAGRYGGTYARTDIAFEFASWISPEFKLYIIKDYKRLKTDEKSRISLDWNLNREIAKLNYRIHTDAIKENLIPPELTKEQMSFIYADEADMLNVVLFGMTAKEWHTSNKNKKGNIRDYASIRQLLVLANMESYNSILIAQGLTQEERMIKLRELSIQQLNTLNEIDVSSLPQLKDEANSN